jgi:predicted acylesterase/phospholipase RssA/proteasome lid subunit RPN8/RPN11
MYGFITRLDSWVRDAALNNLDPGDAPLHPPVAYVSSNRLVVPIADAPRPTEETWYGFASLRDRHNRTELVDWIGFDGTPPALFAAAILLARPLPFEFPRTVLNLTNELEKHGIPFGFLARLLALLALRTPFGTPFLVVVGTPMRRVAPRGPLLQHLAAWEIDTHAADELRKLNAFFLNDPQLAEMGEEAKNAVAKWAVEADVTWCELREMRPEVTRRRDAKSPMSWFRGKRVAIWGCGAIGTHVAESVVRAGASRVELVDNRSVEPGLLVRQGFEDADIGQWKAAALGEQLKRINPDLEVEPLIGNLIHRLAQAAPIPAVDLVIDCTASSAVRMKLEEALRGLRERPPIASMGVGHDASSAIATVAAPNHTGGPLDLIRRLKLEACRAPRLSRLLDDFWPAAPMHARFQPEPGCSEPTFVGSDADLAGLSARMLNAVARALSNPDEGWTAFGWLFEEHGPVHGFSWRPDYTLGERGRGYSVRVSPEAVREMRAWARRSARTSGTTVETGGLVFGELNEAAGVLWVTEVEGPPPDSEAAEEYFTCGIAGMRAVADEKKRRFRGSVDCVGSWHTHPTTRAHPSKVDIGAVEQLLAAPDSTRRTCVLLILSGSPDDPMLGAHAFRTALRRDNLVCIEAGTAATTRVGPEPDKPRDIGLALSGGGSRAIAFHLGCVRALNDLGLLNRLQVVSSVSGGSVLSAMYAYSSDSFSEFDARVVELLRRGLTRDIAKAALRPSAIGRTAWSLAASAAASGLRLVFRLVPTTMTPAAVNPAMPPPSRSYSRTEAFRDALKSLFGDTLMREVRRPLETVVNATELRTGSAFRFGSRQSGCWRFGTIAPEDALVADAVAASAAYPALLPALDRRYRFAKGGLTSGPTRVLLTDGGVFENLGVGPMEPGRKPSISTNAFSPSYIICCDAGAGLLDDDSHPTWWPGRMYRSFLTVFRKVQDATRNRLHRLAESGEVSGFVLAYLGQDDDRLPWFPPELPTRREVYNYPTDYSPMDAEDVRRLALRGEILTRFLVAYYLPRV